MLLNNISFKLLVQFQINSAKCVDCLEKDRLVIHRVTTSDNEPTTMHPKETL